MQSILLQLQMQDSFCFGSSKEYEATDWLFSLWQVKSTVPFSVPFEIDPANPPASKDYNSSFANLKEGVTGKLEEQPVGVRA